MCFRGNVQLGWANRNLQCRFSKCVSVIRLEKTLTLSPSLSLSLSLPLSPSLLSATLSYDESDFAIRQTRTRSNLDQLSWQVWGVATVLQGGADANILFYLFDCYHSTFTDGLAWVRVDADVEVNNDAFNRATRLRVSVDNEISNYLGLYACTAPDGSMEHLNITDGEYSVVC